jgi:hypothetical protein
MLPAYSVSDRSTRIPNPKSGINPKERADLCATQRPCKLAIMPIYHMLFLDGVFTTTPWDKSRFHRTHKRHTIAF